MPPNTAARSVDRMTLRWMVKTRQYAPKSRRNLRRLALLARSLDVGHQHRARPRPPAPPQHDHRHRPHPQPPRVPTLRPPPLVNPSAPAVEPVRHPSSAGIPHPGDCYWDTDPEHGLPWEKCIKDPRCTRWRHRPLSRGGPVGHKSAGVCPKTGGDRSQTAVRHRGSPPTAVPRP